MADIVLEVKDLNTSFYTEEGQISAVDSLGFQINRGETLCIVGESGCGKSVAALSIMGLIPIPPGRIEGGEIIFQGEDLLKKSEKEMEEVRGNQISMIFQEPMTALNPVYTIGNQIEEVYRRHENLSKGEAYEKTLEMLELVGIPLPAQRIREYPHQMSGGMRQRIMIAMALVCNPMLLIADEPTTALDVTIQAQILKLMKKLKERFDTAIMLITHDLGVVAEVAQNVIVMYAGKGIEYAEVNTLFNEPKHPYTEGLLKSIPMIDEEQDDLDPIEGVVPSLLEMPKGCKFHPRCKDAKEICTLEEPPLKTVDGTSVRCFKYTVQWPED